MKKNSTVKRLMKEMTGKYRTQLIIVLFLIIISSVANVAGSFFIQRLVDDYIAPLLLAEHPVFTALFTALLIMGLIYFVGVIATLIYNRMMVNVAQGVLRKIRDEMFAHMQALPIKYYDTHTHGDLMSRYTNDTDTLREMLSMSLPQAFSSIITIIAVTVAMLILSIPLSLFVFVCVAVMLWIVKKVGSKAAAHFKEQQRALGSMNGYIEEMINGQRVVKVFCHEEAAKAQFDVKNEELRKHASTATGLTNILMPVMMNIGAVQYVLIALLGGALAINGVAGMTLGTIAAFLTLSKAFSAPIGQMSTQINAITMALAGAERIFNLLDEECEVDDGYVTLVNTKSDNECTECTERTGTWAWKHPHEDGSITYTPLQGDVRFFDVDFGYNEEKLVLHDVTLYAKPGQKLAFVGATGAGKTTITNLINRFYDIADGKIRFDGININKIKKADLRRSLGIVLQDTHLFTGTVAENIRYGKLSATEEEIINAAKIANAHDFIMRLPEGYSTVISGDGGNLSGGQRQLLAIARAAVADPPVMILDEATSSIDTRTEAIVQKGMDGLMEGRTVFVIAHRLSTVKNADAIMVLEQGRVIERGSHETLIEAKGKYYQLYTGAFADNA
ncbi:MAG: ABC transporter ATP-binding protein/permease [Oscillospiraceae bacterium]|jgi:ATP-binding cassette subfamily B protein|nr:ABC transporter ATP-binding protein/permease [Oscillospiraceae bacterium]